MAAIYGVSNRPVPFGFQEDWNATIWNVGHVFTWSPVFAQWIKTGAMVSVRPDQCIADAFCAAMGRKMDNDTTLFFVED